MGQRFAEYGSTLLRQNQPDHPIAQAVYGCDPRGDEVFNGKTGWQYTSVEDLVRKTEPTVAVIAVPAVEHLNVLRKLKEAHPQCAVLLEKPISNHALTNNEVQWCNQLEGLIAVGYNWRFHPLAKQFWNAREGIHDLTLFVAQEMTSWPGKNYCDPLREFSHEIDLVQFLTIKPVLTAATIARFGGPGGVCDRSSYQLTGTHQQGNFRIHILPNSSPSSRWVRIEMNDGAVVQRQWDQQSNIIEATYHEELLQLIDTYMYDRPSEELSCSLTDALQTTRMIDHAEGLIG